MPRENATAECHRRVVTERVRAHSQEAEVESEKVTAGTEWVV